MQCIWYFQNVFKDSMATSYIKRILWEIIIEFLLHITPVLLNIEIVYYLDKLNSIENYRKITHFCLPFLLYGRCLPIDDQIHRCMTHHWTHNVYSTNIHIIFYVSLRAIIWHILSDTTLGNFVTTFKSVNYVEVVLILGFKKLWVIWRIDFKMRAVYSI